MLWRLKLQLRGDPCFDVLLSGLVNLNDSCYNINSVYCNILPSESLCSWGTSIVQNSKYYNNYNNNNNGITPTESNPLLITAIISAFRLGDNTKSNFKKGRITVREETRKQTYVSIACFFLTFCVRNSRATILYALL